jgi:hypothetical protein
VQDIGSIFDAVLKGGLSVFVKFLALLVFIGGGLIATGPIMGDERMGGHGRKILGAIAVGGIVSLGAASIATWLASLVSH